MSGIVKGWPSAYLYAKVKPTIFQIIHRIVAYEVFEKWAKYN